MISPFTLSKSGRLFITNDFARIITNDERLLRSEKVEEFFNNKRSAKRYYSVRSLNTYMWVHYKSMYRMNISVSRLKNSDGIRYYISGYSGDSEMYGKNMVRATKECIINFMAKFYPIVKHIPKFYNKLKSGEDLYEIIFESIRKTPSLSKYADSKILRKIKLEQLKKQCYV